MHGTKASTPKYISKDPENRNLPISVGKHDFGGGWYFFRDDIIAAFSFAVDRGFLWQENPCVVTFPEPECAIDKIIIDVNHKEINMKKLRKYHLRSETQFNDLNNAQQGWDEKTKNWEIAVALSRWWGLQLENIYPGKPKILMGWLHDGDTTGATDNFRAEPQIDADKWMQYCVKDWYVLGKKMLFIEFMIDWDQWDDREAISGDITGLWRQHMEEQVRKDHKR